MSTIWGLWDIFNNITRLRPSRSQRPREFNRRPGAAGTSGGSAIGGFLGAIVNGEGENEVVKFYDEELRSGKILVVAEDESPQAESKLTQAAAILAESAVEPA